MRQESSRPLIVELEGWLREQHAKLSKNNDRTNAINYCFSRWDTCVRRWSCSALSTSILPAACHNCARLVARVR